MNWSIVRESFEKCGGVSKALTNPDMEKRLISKVMGGTPKERDNAMLMLHRLRAHLAGKSGAKEISSGNYDKLNFPSGIVGYEHKAQSKFLGPRPRIKLKLASKPKAKQPTPSSSQSFSGKPANSLPTYVLPAIASSILAAAGVYAWHKSKTKDKDTSEED